MIIFFCCTACLILRRVSWVYQKTSMFLKSNLMLFVLLHQSSESSVFFFSSRESFLRQPLRDVELLLKKEVLFFYLGSVSLVLPWFQSEIICFLGLFGEAKYFCSDLVFLRAGSSMERRETTLTWALLGSLSPLRSLVDRIMLRLIIRKNQATFRKYNNPLK